MCMVGWCRCMGDAIWGPYFRPCVHICLAINKKYPSSMVVGEWKWVDVFKAFVVSVDVETVEGGMGTQGVDSSYNT